MSAAPAQKNSSKEQDTLTYQGPLPEKAEVVVIGAGVIGLAIAYNLCKRGLTDICIVDRGYLANGASGRNGGGIRQQWSTESNIRLMQESVKLCRGFAKEVGVNIWFRQGGYLFVARTEKEVERLQRNIDVQNKCGVSSRMLDAKGAQKVVPQLNTDGILGAAYNPSDGILFPWPFLWGYAARAVQRGAKLFTHTNVIAIDREGANFRVHTERGSIFAKRLINGAGAWSKEVAKMVGVHIPTYAMRHEICSSEPLKPFLGPMISELSSGLYLSQSMRGEIVGGVTLNNETPTLRMGSRLKFLTTYSRQLVKLLPVMGNVKVLRQWAGPYDHSPDGNPIVGECIPNFFLACGFVGHGFMMAPIVGELYGEWLANGEKHEFFNRHVLSRFDNPSLSADIEKEDFNIG